MERQREERRKPNSDKYCRKSPLMISSSKDNVEPVSWLSSTYLEALLRLKQHDPTLQVVHYQVAPASRKGDNYLGDLLRVSIQVRGTQDGEKTVSLILKCKPRGGYREDFINTGKFYTKEREMLSKTLPEMYGLLKNIAPKLRMTPDYIDCVSDASVLIMEDLSETGFRLAKRNGLDLAHCMMVMKYLGVFHALSVAINEHKPDLLNLYRQNVFCDETRDYMGSYLMSTIRSLASEVEKWPGYKEEYTEKLIKVADNSWKKIRESTTKDESFNVLNHGDLWVNNIMFRYSTGGEIEDLRFIDFQMPHFTSPAIDLHYFMYSSPEPEVRACHYDTLLLEYHKHLSDTLDLLGTARKALTFDQLRTDLNKRMFYAFFAACSCLPNILSDPDQGFDLESSLESGENPSSNNRKMFESEIYKREIQRLLPIFDQHGIF
ncbi:uncharacterized protein [Anabrus simplex]|uniref:uncharacterized protein isoform X2 n=1 Tax=Anabrus simplex TaxID=316456 RepID=UPI0035A3ABDC